MIKVTPLKQGNYLSKLGFSNYTIKSHGCALTALTMLYNHITGKMYTPSEINTKLKSLGEYSIKNKKGAFSGALLVWQNIPLALPELKNPFRHYNYDNIVAAKFVYWYRLPIMCEVNAASIGASKHWVLLLGNYMMADPFTGKITSMYKSNDNLVYPLTGLTEFKKV